MPQGQTTSRPENVSVEELRQYLTEVEGKTATQRIMVGINHKEGIPQTTLADWYDVSRTTIHNWLNRLERLDEEPLEDVIYDDDRPGRPSKLDDDQRAQLRKALSDPPTAAGFDANTWSPKLVRSFIADAFDVDYCLSYVRQLINEIQASGGSGRDETSQSGSMATGPHATVERSGDVVGPKNSPSNDDETDQYRVHGCR
ncbi:MAG: transposase [Halodesulfurarchaeum sp.]